MAVNATAVWRFRPSGSNSNGGGYDSGISGAATDYSQQNSAQASGTHGAGSGTTTFTDATAAAFTSAMVGNCINISGQGFYFVTAFTNASNVVVDRALGTFSGASWSLGGAWGGGDIVTNLTNSGPVVTQNKVYFLGSGTPNPSSYTYDYTTAGTSSFMTPSAGSVYLLNDPSTPGYKAAPDTTGGMPTIQITANATVASSNNNTVWEGLWFVPGGATANVAIISSGLACTMIGCVFDQFGTQSGFTSAVKACTMVGCEVFSSTGGTGLAAYGMMLTNANAIGCNIHDCTGPGIQLDANGGVINSIIAKCSGDGIFGDINGGNSNRMLVANNTIDGNSGNGITLGNSVNTGLMVWHVYNNIFSNHTGAGKYGMSVNAGTTAANDTTKQFIDYNSFYNNTSNYNAISAGAHDTALGTNPYLGQATENYALA